MKTATEIFEKYGEHGVGKPVHAIVSSNSAKRDLFLKYSLSNAWKVEYFFVNGKSPEDALKKEFLAFLTSHHYTKNYIFDHHSFYFFLELLSHIPQGHLVLDKICVFDPVGFVTKKGLLQKKNYTTNLLGESVSIQTKQPILTLHNFHLLHAKEIYIIGFNDPGFAFKVATALPNAKYRCVTEYAESISVIQELYQ